MHQQRESTPADSDDLKVLLIDPSPLHRLYFNRLFEADKNVVFREAQTLSEALPVSDSLLPTVVLFGLHADDEQSIAPITRLRNNPSTADIPILALSDFRDEALSETLLRAGATASVAPTLAPERLLLSVRAHASQYLDLASKVSTPDDLQSEPNSPARVLMVDDSPVICMAVQKKLREPVEFTACNDPGAGLETARAFDPTVILLDLEMPGISGFELLKILRRDPATRSVPVIVLSAITDPKVKAEAFGLGANDYAEKNMDAVELNSRIHYHTRAYLNARKLSASIRELLENKKRIEVQRNFIRRTFGRYLSDDIVASILETPDGLEIGGEKRTISIMMADLRGFTAMSERLPPESVLSIVNNYLRVMTDILFRHQGTIDEFLGDAILAMFGAPIVRGDDAQRAIACAMEMQLAMKEVNAWNRAQGYPDVAMGIGINTGEVVVGNIGSERRSKYGIVGGHVNLTARIESYTVGGQVLVSPATWQQCAELLRVDSEMTVQPKGVKEPITLYEVGGIGGDYGLYLPPKNQVALHRLAEPISVRFAVLDGKHARKKLRTGALVALGDACADMTTRTKLDPLTNLKITVMQPDGSELSQDLYAKVVTAKGSGHATVRLALTSVSPAVEKVFEALVQRS